MSDMRMVGDDKTSFFRLRFGSCPFVEIRATRFDRLASDMLNLFSLKQQPRPGEAAGSDAGTKKTSAALLRVTKGDYCRQHTQSSLVIRCRLERDRHYAAHLSSDLP